MRTFSLRMVTFTATFLSTLPVSYYYYYYTFSTYPVDEIFFHFLHTDEKNMLINGNVRTKQFQFC